jgi:flagellar hook-associated protein 2
MSTSVNGITSSSSSTTTSSPTTVNGIKRYYGLASGLDVDSIVKSLMTSDQQKIDIQQQQKQTLQWKQAAYQSITTDLQAFKSSYLSILSGNSSMVQSSNLQSFTGTSSSSVLSVFGTVGAQLGNHVVEVYQSAVASTVTGTALSASITGNIDTRTLNATNLEGTSFSINVDGVSKNISFSGSDNYSDVGTLIDNKLKASYGTDISGNCKVTAAVDGNGYLTLQSNGGYESVINVTSASSNDALTQLGITSGASNRINAGSSLQVLFGSELSGVQSDGSFVVNINNTDVTLNINENITQTTNRINAANTGASATYNNLTDKITFTSTQGGAAGNITLDDKGTGLFDSLLGTSTTVLGKDAIVSLDGVKVTRSSNNFTINGINLTINSSVVGPASQTSNITLANNVDSTVSVISKFVDAYNKVITNANNLTQQKPDPNYKPLTDAQKANMSADAITKWETKAQQGVIFSDSAVTGILNKMRQMLSSPVTTSNGKTMYLSDIGITTGNYLEGGQLNIDTTKLTTALKQSPDDVMQLFTKTSTIPYSGAGINQSQRLNDEGLSYRLQDIVNNAAGFNGTLLQMAGMPSDATTQNNNAIYKQLTQINSTIKDLQKQYTNDQTKYYNQFTKLETFMSNMNSQSSYFTNMLSSNSGG